MQEGMARIPPDRPRSNTNAIPTLTNSPLIQQMAQAMTQMMEAQGREDWYKSFRRHDHPTFLGVTDPLVAKNGLINWNKSSGL
jgi:hypothetical protein